MYLCSYLMKGRELMSGGSFKQLTGNWNIFLLCVTWADKEMGSRWTKLNYPVHQAAWLNRITDEASVPDANFCGRKLTIPCRRSPHDHKTRPEILRSSRGNIQFNNLKLQVHRSTRGLKWMLRSLFWWKLCRFRLVVHWWPKSSPMRCSFLWNTSLWDTGFTDLHSRKLAPGVHWTRSAYPLNFCHLRAWG